MRISTTEEFIRRARLIHGDSYEYHKTVYVNYKQKVIITCKTHGDFEQTPDNHLSGRTCRHCAKISRHLKKTHSLETVIKMFKNKHGDRYVYDNVIYTKIKNHVIIICKKHGPFRITPDDHIQGKGCKKCKISKGEFIIAKILSKEGIEYIREKTFDDCKHIKLLKFDFYIRDIGSMRIVDAILIWIIEFDGEQHFRPISRFGGYKKFVETVKRDHIKNKYCRDNKIGLIRVPYYVKDVYEFLCERFDYSSERLNMEIRIHEIEQRMTVMEYNK
jgi:hypothetical protein